MTEEYELERTAAREDVATILRGIADGVAAGSVRLGDDEPIAVEIPESVELEVEFETDDGRNLEIELEWDEATSVEAFADESAADAPAEGGDAASDADTIDAGSDDSDADRGDDDGDDVTDLPVGPAAPRESLARFELFADRADEWRWRLVHRNGNVIATSGEGYTRKHNAKKGLRSVMSNAADAETVEED